MRMNRRVTTVRASANVVPRAELGATDKMSCTPPGVMRERIEASDRFNTNECPVGGERSIGDRAERRAPVGAQHSAKLRGTMFELGDRLGSRDRARSGG